MRRFLLALYLGAAAACDEGHAVAVPDADPGAPDGGPRAQSPPMTAPELLAWLAERHYEAWHCEPAPHEARPPGPHGTTRICSNDLLAAAGPSGAFPIGAASVKELIDGDRVTGWAVAVKAAAESGAAGEGWYWYERGDGETYGDGRGFTGCTDCHRRADARFAPTARDFVFTQVMPGM